MCEDGPAASRDIFVKMPPIHLRLRRKDQTVFLVADSGMKCSQLKALLAPIVAIDLPKLNIFASEAVMLRDEDLLAGLKDNALLLYTIGEEQPTAVSK